MTEQKIIKEHIEELQRRIETVKRFMRTHKDADVSSCKDNIWRWETIIIELGKRIQRKPDKCNNQNICPECADNVLRYMDYCRTCGQAIDWSK